ncbi:MAG: hypothetical protein KIT54_02430 [Phycisphaeraceae bacterium]|nr:hypothetical protein [Phycisphaeraceae bacterium]
MTHRQRIAIVLACPDDLSEREAIAELRRVLKRVLRPWGWRCVDLSPIKPPDPETPAPPTP